MILFATSSVYPIMQLWHAAAK